MTWMTPAQEEAWRSNPAAQRFDALVQLDYLARTQPARLALPPRPRNPRPGVWATDAGEFFVATGQDADQYGDTYTEVRNGTDHVFRRVDAARWQHLRLTLADHDDIRAALVHVFGLDAIERSEAANPISKAA